MTVRTVRSHVTRGLLPPPRLRGRTALYDTEHLARLQLIAGLQQQGFSLAAVEAVVRRTPARSAEQALAFYRDILGPWQPEEPVELPVGELADWLGAEPDAATLDGLHAAGMLAPVGRDRVRIINPALLRAGAQAVRLGMPVGAVLAVRPELIRHARAISELFVGLFRDTIWSAHIARGKPREELSEMREIVEALQPVAAQALLAAFRATMPEAIESFIREQLAAVERHDQ